MSWLMLLIGSVLILYPMTFRKISEEEILGTTKDDENYELKLFNTRFIGMIMLFISMYIMVRIFIVNI